MKHILILLFIVTSMSIQCQTKVFGFVTQDVKMSYEGPHGDGGVLNPELGLGFQLSEYYRIWGAYEWLEQISYQKLTFLAFDYIQPLGKRLNAKLGVETSIIYRRMDNPNYYRYGYNEDNLSYGANAEIAYKILGDNCDCSSSMYIFANTNVFKAEPKDNLGNPMKDVRWDVRIGVLFDVPLK